MTDIIIIAPHFNSLAQTLTQIETLSPAPSPKGRYALAKIASKFSQEHATYKNSFKKFLDEMVTKDDKGMPIYEVIDNEQVKFSVLPEKTKEYFSGVADFDSETITLTNVRPITHAELGSCPITVGHERILLACGILTDEEPA
jgi:hypothetical protein